MQGQRQRLRGCGLQLELRTGQNDLIADRIGGEFLVDQPSHFRALPARQRQHRMHPRQRVDPPFHRTDVGLDVFAPRQPNDGLRQCQGILGAVIDLPGEQVLAFLGVLSLGDVDGDPADADHAARFVDGGGGCADAPAYFAIGADNAKLGLV